MPLKNLMGDKRLDFNQPLLTVRRNFTSPVAFGDRKGKTDFSLKNKTELKSVRNPGTVPFVWEKTPGQPKEQLNLHLQKPNSIPPKLIPPGKQQQCSRKRSAAAEAVAASATPAPNVRMDTTSTNSYRRDPHLIHADSSKSSYNFQETSRIITNSKVGRKIVDLESQESCCRRRHGCYYSKHPFVVPPLPKAPSESWLRRTLPIVSARNSSSRSCLGTCNYAKWETMVRCSDVRHGRLRVDEEQLPPIPEA